MAKSNFMKSLKSWTTPAFSERAVMKGAWKVGKGAFKFAWRRPILTAALSYAATRPFDKYKRGKKRVWGSGPTAGRLIMSRGKWLG
jgi:hypothetical protein|tara:strand:+ start:573 stop:830 length:258 start_codon:yes stop_codon:yes gene_type:complete